MVYEAGLTAAKEIDPQNAIHVYWMAIDPEYDFEEGDACFFKEGNVLL